MSKIGLIAFGALGHPPLCRLHQHDAKPPRVAAMLRMSAGRDGIPYLGPASHVPHPNCTVVRTSDHPSPVGSDREAIYDSGVSTVDDDRRDVCRLNRRGWYQANNISAAQRDVSRARSTLGMFPSSLRNKAR